MGMQIGILIKSWRTREGLSQSDAAEKIGVKQPTISAWESGSLLPDAKNIRKIAQAIGMSADDLLADAPPDELSGHSVDLETRVS